MVLVDKDTRTTAIMCREVSQNEIFDGFCLNVTFCLGKPDVIDVGFIPSLGVKAVVFNVSVSSAFRRTS